MIYSNLKMNLRLKILFLINVLNKSNVYKYNKTLGKSQFWSQERIESYQNNRLRKLIYHSYSTVPYYRDLFDNLSLKPSDINSKEDLKKLPILTKEDIRINFPKRIVSKLFEKRAIKISSSGSTGEPLQYLINKEAYEMNFSTKLRGWSWSGWNFGENYAKISNHPRNGIFKNLYDLIFGCKYIYDDGLDDDKCLKIMYSPFLQLYPHQLYLIV